VCEDPQTRTRHLDIANAYDYHGPDHEWWWAPRTSGQAGWTAPYFDEGAGEILMATYSVPFKRDGEFWGVATVDIPLATLEEVIDLDDLPDNDFVIIDEDGLFVAHPDPSRILKDGLAQMAERLDRPNLATTATRMAAGESGVTSLPDFDVVGETLWLYYAPIRSTNWTFAAVVAESEALAFVRETALRALVGLAVILLLIVVAVVVVSRSLTDPIKKLEQGVAVLAGGNLDAEPIEIQSRDEIGNLGRAFNDMVTDLRDHVERLAAETAAREAVEGELKAARQIQSALLPRTFPPYPDRQDLDLHASLIPAKSVAGDFFDFFLVGDDKLVFNISDVSGKGVPAALFMAVARTLLRNLATVTLDPGEMFTRCSDMLNKDNPGAMFVTSFLAVLDMTTGTVTYANAGHPPPYRLDAKGNVSVFGKSTGMMLGIFPEAQYATLEDRLAPGDRLVLFTDGVTEAESPDETMLEDEGFVEILREIGSGKAAEVCQHVCDRVLAFEQGNQSDDITVLVVGRIPGDSKT
jgi:sigma-B regulation protein RsbU (phosphoserine phosphatase)